MGYLRDGFSRRSFIKKSSEAGFGVLLGVSGISALQFMPVPGGQEKSDNRFLNIKPRYYRWHVDPGVEWLETNTGYATLDWKIPLSQTALVLVDVWQRHYIKDTEERGEKIIVNTLVPLMSRCRNAGLQIIHAPSPPVARQHMNWVNLEKPSGTAKRDDWPPTQFINSSGPYESYRRPKEPREAERQNLPPLQFHPKAVPVGNEPVIAPGYDAILNCFIT